MLSYEENLKESLLLVHQEEAVSRKDQYASTAKTKATWYENAINLNDANHVEKLAMDEKPALIQDATDAMRWAI